LAANLALLDDLREVVDGWVNIPDLVKAKILFVVRSYCRKVNPDRRRADVMDALQQAHSDERRGLP